MSVYYGTDHRGDTVGPAYCEDCAPVGSTYGGRPWVNCPEHCDSCEECLDVQLTSDGIHYTREAVAEDDMDPELREQWLDLLHENGVDLDRPAPRTSWRAGW